MRVTSLAAKDACFIPSIPDFLPAQFCRQSRESGRFTPWIKSFPRVRDGADTSAVWRMIRQALLQTLFHRVCVFSRFSEKRIMEPQLRMENRCDRFQTMKPFKNWRLSRVNCERLVTGILRIGEAAAPSGTRHALLYPDRKDAARSFFSS
jgi:hypothetical protein